MKKIPAILAGVYGALVLLSIVPIFTEEDALSGVILIVLGLPWTALMTRAVDAINPNAFDNVAGGFALGLAGCAINAAVIYFVAKWVVGKLAE